MNECSRRRRRVTVDDDLSLYESILYKDTNVFYVMNPQYIPI